MTAGMPTFQQTFANCPFPEGVLAVLGRCPVQVRVLRARRAMEVAVSGTAVPQEILTQASDILKRVFGLSTVTVAVVQVDSVEHDKQGRLCRRMLPRQKRLYWKKNLRWNQRQRVLRSCRKLRFQLRPNPPARTWSLR